MVQGPKAGNVIRIFLAFLLASCHVHARAQDDHYWAQQYGAESSLMGGSVVAGVADNSAVFYNPAAVAYIDNPSLSVDANVYKFDRIIIDDGGGQGVNLNSGQISVYPQIIAGMIPLFKESRFRFSYSVLTRNHGNILFSARYTSPDANAGSPSVKYIGVFDYINQLNEQWFGFTGAYRISNRLSGGITFLSSYRGQTYQLVNYIQQIDSLTGFTSTKNNEEIKTSHFRALVKLGISYVLPGWKFGLTVTTPSIRLYGSGNMERENSVVTISDDPADMKDNFLISDRKTGIPAKYRHPLSLAAGIEYSRGNTRIAISGEYFFRIGQYTVMHPESTPFVYPPSYLDSSGYGPGAVNYLQLESRSKPVFNLGVGISQVVFEHFTILAGVYTDFSSYDGNGDKNLMHGFENVNFYHTATGVSYKRPKQSITLGFTYGFTPDRIVSSFAVVKPGGDLSTDAVLSSHTYSVVLGYIYYLRL